MDNIKLSESGVIILDQTKLPNEEIYLELKTKEEMYDAIYTLKVRGAPAIGIFAGYALYSLARDLKCKSDDFKAELKRLADYLEKSRPTAVNLKWALTRMLNAGSLDAMKHECKAIHNEDIAICTAMAEHGLKLLKDGDSALTYCNAGPIATSRYGTALGSIILGSEKGYNLKAYCCETRPLLQGRLTAYELSKAGVDTTLICDNMASIVMKEKRVNACFVGCDRVAVNGDTANKIGTSGVAVLAKHYGIPFYVCCPSPTIDFDCKNGDDIKIEFRSGDEIRSDFFKKPIAPPEMKCYNPAFDITENSLITAIITEKGICYPPFSESLKVFLDCENNKI